MIHIDLTTPQISMMQINNPKLPIVLDPYYIALRQQNPNSNVYFSLLAASSPHYQISGKSSAIPGTLDLLGQSGFLLEPGYNNQEPGKGHHSTTSYHDETRPATDTTITGGGLYYFRLKNGATQANIYNEAGAKFLRAQHFLEVLHGGSVGTFLNEGTVASDEAGVANQGDIGSITNTGKLEGGEAAVGNLTGGTIGPVTNSGTLGGRYAVENYGTIKSITNTGKMAAVLNYGTVEKDVALGGAQYIAAGTASSVGGTVSGTSGDGSSIATGDADNASITKTSDIASVSVDKISVAAGSRLTVEKGNDWHVLSDDADAWSNGGEMVLNGDSAVDGNLTNLGTLSLGNGHSISTIINGNVTSSGSIVLNPTDRSAGNTLTINGNYAGVKGSTVSIGTVLGNDASLTDLLNITGNTSGQSTVYVTNENGAGARTLEGIKVISVGGTSGADFSLGNRVVAGVYDYSLKARNDGYYLTSVDTPTPIPTPTPTPVVHMVRPETGAYSANLQGSRTLFNLSLNDRAGTSLYTDPLTGETHSTSMWMSNEGGRNTARLADGQNKTSINRYVLQLGGDVAAWESDAAGRLSVGVMGGYANQSSNTRNALTGNDAKGSVNGYTAGLYGTWHQNPADRSGLYMDSWLQYGWFNNEVKGKDLAPETYKSHGLGASVETGYSWRLLSLLSSKGTEGSFWLQPHAQVQWTGVKADDHTESNGTRVQGTGSDGVETKLGVRAFLKGKAAQDQGTAREFEPFVEANWIYRTENDGVRMNGDEDHITGVRNAGELKAGVEGQLTEKLSMDVSVGQQVAGKGYSDTEGVLGLKYSF